MLGDNLKNFNEGYEKFRKAGGLLKYIDEETSAQAYLQFALAVDTNTNSFIIELTKEDSIEEQVKSFIHEILHLSSRYRLALHPNRFIDVYEDEIEEEAEEVYSTQHDIVAHLRERVISLKKLSDWHELEAKIIHNIRDTKEPSDEEIRRNSKEPKPELSDQVYSKLKKLQKEYEIPPGCPTYFEIDFKIGVEYDLRRWITDIENRSMGKEFYEKLLNLEEEGILRLLGLTSEDRDKALNLDSTHLKILLSLEHLKSVLRLDSKNIKKILSLDKEDRDSLLNYYRNNLENGLKLVEVV